MNTYDETLDATHRANYGAFYSNSGIVEFVLKLSLAKWYDAVMQSERSIPEKVEKIMQVKVVDPTFGGAAFLIGTASYLLARRAELCVLAKNTSYEMHVKTQGAYAEWVADNNLFGCELDPEAAVHGKIALAEYLLAQGASNPPEFNGLHVGNALVAPEDIALDISLLNPFDWDALYPTKFDVVVGNPPWLTITDPLMLSFLKVTKQYRLQNPKYAKGEARGGNGDPNTYKLATERFLSLIKDDGSFGFIVPEGVAADKGNRDLRMRLLESGLSDIVGFQKKNHVFKTATQSFCAVAGSRGRGSDGADSVRYTTNHTEIRAAEIVHSKASPLKLSEVSRLALSTKPLIALNSTRDVNLFRRLVAAQENGIRIKAYRELDTTKDMDLTQTGPMTKGYAVIKGNDTGRFCPPVFEELSYGLNKSAYVKRHPSRAAFVDQERVVWHGISGTTDERRMVATVIPAGLACFNSLNVIQPSTKSSNHYMAGILNSLCYEWLVRLVAKNNNINIFVVEGIFLPRLEGASSNSTKIIKLSRTLHGLPSNSDKRPFLEAELEAAVALIYGLSRDDLEHLLTAFPKVNKAYKAMVLEAFNEISV